MSYLHDMFELATLRSSVLGVILLLFSLCFFVIFIEETFLGGRRRRRMERALREKSVTDQREERPCA